jgi:hypothetical protein
VGNPHPNERIPAGLDIQGIAFEPLASDGSGINRIQLFVEDRDQGGLFLGEASQDVLITNAWQIQVNLPLGPHNLFVYARSAITGTEAVVTIPVQIVP